MVTSSWKPILEGSRSFLSSGETPAHEQTIESAALVSLSLSLPFMTLFLECRPSAVPFRGFSVSSAFSSVFLFENAISRRKRKKSERECYKRTQGAWEAATRPAAQAGEDGESLLARCEGRGVLGIRLGIRFIRFHLCEGRGL